MLIVLCSVAGTHLLQQLPHLGDRRLGGVQPLRAGLPAHRGHPLRLCDAHADNLFRLLSQQQRRRQRAVREERVNRG